MLCLVGLNEYCLVNVRNGEYWSSPIQVKRNPYMRAISVNQFIKLIGKENIYVFTALLSPLISEKLLLKLHFHKDNYGLYEKVVNNGKYISGCKIELWIKKCKLKPKGQWFWDIGVGKTLSSVRHVAYVQYMHELKREYFKLTGKELK